TPKTYTIQSNLLIRATPNTIISALKTMAPRIPQKRTRCWYRLGILKDLKITAITNTLSMLRESSMRYPVTYFSTALSGVRPVELGSMSEENSHQITPENPRARLTHTEVQIAASFDFIT